MPNWKHRIYLAHGDDLLRLALDDLAELGDEIPWIGMQWHARRQCEVAVAAAGTAWRGRTRRKLCVAAFC